LVSITASQSALVKWTASARQMIPILSSSIPRRPRRFTVPATIQPTGSIYNR